MEDSVITLEVRQLVTLEAGWELIIFYLMIHTIITGENEAFVKVSIYIYVTSCYILLLHIHYILLLHIPLCIFVNVNLSFMMVHHTNAQYRFF